jgi:predicted flap endonuclease-1-like 5' DNA nuclease
MSHILSILRAAHCRSTHHYFVLDALQKLKTAQAQRLANILLKYHDDYLVGAKAPDCSFKDFKNHVIHVSDNNWGGAPQKCQEWLAQAREYLDRGNWKKAAYACGVLSHYFTDPIMPLHTAQHPREQAVHRPLEWSICQSYDEIYNLCRESGYECDFELAVDDQWISKAVLAAAAVAHRHYDRLVAIYDVERGVAKPRAGLNDEAMTILAELFALTIGGLSRVLTRLADETTRELPQVSLTLASILATIDMPLAWIAGRISDSQERRAVQAVFNEYHKTGSLKRYLPAEIAVVREAKIAEPNLGIRQPALASLSISSISPGPTAATKESRRLVDIELPGEILATAPMDTAGQTTSPSLDLADSEMDEVVSESPDSAKHLPEVVTFLNPTFDEQSRLDVESASHQPGEPDRPPAQSFVPSESVAPAVSLAPAESYNSQPLSDRAELESPQFLSLSQARGRLPVQADPSAPGQKVQTEITVESTSADSLARNALRIAPGTMPAVADDHDQNTVHFGSPIVDAPSIGPKTAKRFKKTGICTVQQLISASPESIVGGLATRWITESLVRDWQDQARLVCEVPALSGYRAQLLVAVGCRTSWQLRSANPKLLHTQISQFCQTSEGQHILRSARVPQADDIGNWIESARIFARRDAA